MYILGGDNMKFKKIFPIVICSALLAGASVVAIQHGNRRIAKKANATTDVGEIAIAEVRNAISTNTAMYLLPTAENSLPDSWDYAYTAVGEEDGVFINGTKYGGAAIKHAGTGSAFVTFYFGLPAAASEGDVVEFKGTFASEAAGYSFSIHYGAQYFASTWVHALEDYDTLSLADANMPNFSGAAINTDDMGADYNYVTDPAALPMKKGFFGLTNDTGSYAFQFNYSKTSTGTGWFHVLIGGQGPLWNAGHFIDYGFLDAWADTGHAQIKEMQGNGNNWDADEIQATDAIALGWNVGETNLLEMGCIKVKGSTSRLMFFKVNGTLKWSDYWTLAAGGMTTKVTLQYANDDATVTNSIDVVGTEQLHTSDGTTAGLYTNNNVCPAVSNWDDYFKSVDGEGLQINGTSFGGSAWNYFKKTGANNFYLDLGGASAPALSADDVLYIGGIFKAVREVNGVKVLFKAVFADSYFQYDGTEWHEIYHPSDFARDLLKQTLAICTGEGGDNGTALAAVWSTLSGSSYYGKLSSDDKEDLAIAAADSTVVVPLTAAGVDAMSDSDALGAAMYRYDYCTTKYSLTPFITGRVISLSNTGIKTINAAANIYAIIAVTSGIAVVTVSLFVIYHVLRKRKETR